MTNTLSYVPYLMGGRDRGPRTDVLGGPDRGPRVNVMGAHDPARYPQAVRDAAPRSVDSQFRSPKHGSLRRSAVRSAH